MAQRIGIFGGSFDPIHYGHLAIAEEARAHLDLAAVLVIPTGGQPLKQSQHTATAAHRYAMVELACADNPHLHPSTIEIDRPPPTYSVDTLRHLHATLPAPLDLWFILGADAVGTFPRWRDAATILTLARLAIVQRPNTSVALAALSADMPALADRSVVLPGPDLEISSTDLRRRIAAGLPVRYQMPDRVIDYIAAHRLYASPADA